MERKVIDYSAPSSHYEHLVSEEWLRSPVDQSVVGSVFIVDPTTGNLKDVLSQVVDDPSNPRNSSLMNYLQPTVSQQIDNRGLSDSELIELVKSRYAQSPSEMARYTKSLAAIVDAGIEKPVDEKPVDVGTSQSSDSSESQSE